MMFNEYQLAYKTSIEDYSRSSPGGESPFAEELVRPHIDQHSFSVPSLCISVELKHEPQSYSAPLKNLPDEKAC